MSPFQLVQINRVQMTWLMVGFQVWKKPCKPSTCVVFLDDLPQEFTVQTAQIKSTWKGILFARQSIYKFLFFFSAMPSTVPSSWRNCWKTEPWWGWPVMSSRKGKALFVSAHQVLLLSSSNPARQFSVFFPLCLPSFAEAVHWLFSLLVSPCINPSFLIPLVPCSLGSQPLSSTRNSVCPCPNKWWDPHFPCRSN